VAQLAEHLPSKRESLNSSKWSLPITVSNRTQVILTAEFNIETINWVLREIHRGSDCRNLLGPQQREDIAMAKTEKLGPRTATTEEGAGVSEGAPRDCFCECWKSYKLESISATATNFLAVVKLADTESR
jgi:hypothetical protein